MSKSDFLNYIKLSDSFFDVNQKHDYVLPRYDPDTHYQEISNSRYYKALVVFRNNIKQSCDFYWSQIEGAYNVDLFMMTPSVSSPMGPGSDSEAVEINFGDLKTFLVDSSQFGFEPILINGIDKVYCYLPSMRGENPDKRHLNQFYHCEVEIKGDIERLLPMIEGFVRFLSEVCLNMSNLTSLLSADSDRSLEYLQNTASSESFPQIEFEEAVDILEKRGMSEYINYTPLGRDIRSMGELKLLKILNAQSPVWLKNFDRDRVPFYQKPQDSNKNKVINYDLLFPQIIESSFGGEILGAGQRQDDHEEMEESLARQGVDSSPYTWYINLRKNKSYSTTSGFGLGIERFIAWALCRSDIKEVILYPRLKNIVTHP